MTKTFLFVTCAAIGTIVGCGASKTTASSNDSTVPPPASSSGDDGGGGTVPGTDSGTTTPDGGTPPSPGDICTALIGSWSGEATAKDGKGSHDLTWCGYSGEDGDDSCGTASPSYGPGKVGQAFVFSGSNYVRSFDFTFSGGPFSIDLWVKWASSSQLEWSSAVAASEGQTDESLANTFQIDSDGTGGARVQAGNDVIHVPFGSVSTSDFQHIAMVFTGSKVQTYLNGVPVSSDPWTDSLHFESLKLGMNRTYNRPFRGSVDEVHVWSRALTDADVASINTAGSTGICH